MNSMTDKRKVLGRGLDSLLPAARATATAAAAPAPVQPTGDLVRELPIDQIDHNPYQTRTHWNEAALNELASSIKVSGVLQPVTVRSNNGRFQLITGERRWRASQIAGKATVPAILRQVSNEQAMEMTIIENLQREDLNPMEQARAYERLSREFKLTQEQMAQRTGKDRASVGNYLRLLKLPIGIQGLVEQGHLTFGHARALLALESAQQMIDTTNRISALAMSVRQTETYIQGLINPESKPKPKVAVAPPPQDPNVHEAQDRLQRRLGLKVHIEDKKGRGRVIIEYTGVDDFDAILAALGEQ